MKAIPIDFAPASLQRALWRTPLPAWLAGLAALGLCCAAALEINEIHQQQESLRSQRQALEAKLVARTAEQPRPQRSAITDTQARAINGAVSQLNLPWRDLLNAVENATPGSIALLSVEPDGKKHLLKGTAEAKTADDMLHYIEKLKRQRFFSSVLLVRHETNEQDPNRPLRFQFEAHWAASES